MFSAGIARDKTKEFNCVVVVAEDKERKKMCVRVRAVS